MGSQTEAVAPPLPTANQHVGKNESVSLPKALVDWCQQEPADPAEFRQLAKLIFVSQAS